MSRIHHLYLAGPMRGLPDDNTPAFRSAAKRLRALGFLVFDPSDHEPTQRMTRERGGAHLTTKEYMEVDLPILLKCDAVAMLPVFHGSDGACCEVITAALCGMPVICANSLRPIRFIKTGSLKKITFEMFHQAGEPIECPNPEGIANVEGTPECMLQSLTDVQRLAFEALNAVHGGSVRPVDMARAGWLQQRSAQQCAEVLDGLVRLGIVREVKYDVAGGVKKSDRQYVMTGLGLEVWEVIKHRAAVARETAKCAVNVS